ncbi:MAG: YtfJ family protein [Vibrio sp.]
MFTWLHDSSRVLRLVLLAGIITFSCHGQAQTVTLKHPLPSVSVTHMGAITLPQQQGVFTPWSSHDLLGKVRIIELVPGKADVRSLNRHLLHAISRADFDTTQYQTTAIINASDAFWGTGMFVKSSAIALKKQYPWMTIIYDEDGQVARHWQLTHHPQTTIVIDKLGVVRFIKHGRLNYHNINVLIHIVTQLLRN